MNPSSHAQPGHEAPLTFVDPRHFKANTQVAVAAMP